MNFADMTYEQWEAHFKAEDARLAREMPDEAAALRVMFDAWKRLQQLGWKEIDYCPKDGSVFDSISAGSTGIHPCHYEGEWPSGRWWVFDGGDVWPARPILFRKTNPPAAPASKESSTMSYSFNVKAANKADAKAAVEAEFDKVIEQQPEHERDKAAALANANAAIDLLADDETKDVAVSCNGYISWRVEDNSPGPLTGVSVNASACHAPRA